MGRMGGMGRMGQIGQDGTDGTGQKKLWRMVNCEPRCLTEMEQCEGMGRQWIGNNDKKVCSHTFLFFIVVVRHGYADSL